MDSEVFMLYAYLSFLLAFLYIIVYKGKTYIFIKAIKQSNNSPCMDRHVQQVLSVVLSTQWPLRCEKCWSHCHYGLLLTTFSLISSFACCLSYDQQHVCHVTGSHLVVWWHHVDVITSCHIVQFLCIQSRKYIHHLYIHHVRDRTTWFLVLWSWSSGQVKGQEIFPWILA